MSQSSCELVLKIETQKTDENPYQQKKKLHKSKSIQKTKNYKNNKKRIHHRKKNQHSLMYEIINPHSHLLLLISVVLICIFYTVVLRIKQDYMLDKLYHSICIGVICLLDFLINRESFITFTVSDEYDQTSLKETLLDNKSDSKGTENSELDLKYLTYGQFILFTTTLGVVCFTSELFTFYLLSITTNVFNLNASIGYAFLAFENIIIRMYYSMNDVKIEFINFLGLLGIFIVFILITLNYLSISLAAVAFFISSLKFTKFYLFIELNTYSAINMNKVLLWVNSIDFLIGFIITFVSLILNDKHSLFQFADFFLVLVATVCYYVNMKYFRDYDRYGISIISLTYPMMIIFDLFINHRRILLFGFILILLNAVFIVISFIGDKLWDDSKSESELNETHHENPHSYDKILNKNQYTNSNDPKLSLFERLYNK